jgi:O-antigen/teichoic acid export membrane protein
MFKQLSNFIFSSEYYNLYKNTSVYILATIINSAIPFLLIPFLTNYLSPSDYGILSIHAVLLAFVTPFVGLNTQNYISRLYFVLDKKEMSKYIGNIFFVSIVSVLFVSVSIFLFQDFIFLNTHLPIFGIWSTVLIAFQQFFISIPLTIWQIKNKATYFGVLQISSTALNFLITLYLLIQLNASWTSRIEGQILSGFIIASFSILYLYKADYLKINFNKEYIYSSLKYGVPLIPHAIGGVLLSIANRYFLVEFIGLNETGIYFLAFQFTSIINIFTNALNTAYVPWLFSKLSKPNNVINLKIVKFTYIYYIFLITASLLFLYLLPFGLKYFTGEKYHTAQKYFDWLILGNVFNGMYLMVTNYLFYSKKTYLLAIITFFSALFSIGLNYLLVPIYGGEGAGAASAISFGILFILTFIASNKEHPMPWFYFLKFKD